MDKIYFASLLMQGLLLLKQAEEICEKRKKRSCSVRQINRDRNLHGFFTTTFKRLKDVDEDKFFLYTRMSKENFNILLQLVAPKLIKTSIRTPISPEFRLAVTLQYLSQGSSVQSLACMFKIGKSTCRQIILETCSVIWQILFPLYVTEPSANDFKQIKAEFWRKWGMPNCIGALGGKHIAIRCPPNSDIQFDCYKNLDSIVLMAACDGNYCFTYVDVGTYGSQSDGGIFGISSFGRRLKTNQLPIPVAEKLPRSKTVVPNYFVADAAFPLGTNLMRPYAGVNLPSAEENFNRRLSRARRMIENAFGILAARWRVLLSTIHMYPENAENVILSCVALHNFIIVTKDSTKMYVPENYVDNEDADGMIEDGLWRREAEPLPSIRPSNHIHQYGGNNSKRIRNVLRDYLMIN